MPNVSEGRRAGVVAAMAAAIRASGARLLDGSSDPSHNRSVFTLAGDAAAVERAVLALVDRAVADIDLRAHQGEHPRVGAVDVVPFVPLHGTAMTECVAVANRVGAAIADRFGVPVFLYEEAATNPARAHLEDIRRGGLAALEDRMRMPGWAPDFGPAAPHPTAGVSVVGARWPLIAYNINLATDRIDVARRIAASVRQSSGGLPAVKALGIRLETRGQVQVSMNLTNPATTSLRQVFEAVRQYAEREGVSIAESEIIGLVPAEAMAGIAPEDLQLRHFGEDQILENRLANSERRS